MSTQSQIALILEKYNVKKSAEIMAEIETLLKTKKEKVSRETIERERINPETQEPEIFCRDFQTWMPRTLGVFDKEGKYQYYSKCSQKAFAKFAKMRKAKEAEALKLAIEGSPHLAKELLAELPEKASEWVKTQNWEDFK
jgi:anthranilate/para-aminobenzoate synthase component I